MKLKELKSLLNEMDDEMEVILQKDGEGNGYSPLAGVDNNGIYFPDTPWSGEVYSLDWAAYEVGMEEDEWEEIKKNNNRVLILYPVN